MNALRELIRKHIQRVETRITISTDLLQCHGRFGQTHLRDSRRFAFADQLLGARLTLSQRDLLLGQLFRLREFSLTTIGRYLDRNRALRQFGLAFSLRLWPD